MADSRLDLDELMAEIVYYAPSSTGGSRRPSRPGSALPSRPASALSRPASTASLIKSSVSVQRPGSHHSGRAMAYNRPSITGLSRPGSAASLRAPSSGQQRSLITRQEPNLMSNSGWGADGSMRYSASESTALWPADRAGAAYYLRRRPLPFGAIGATRDVKTTPQARTVAVAAAKRLAARAAAGPLPARLDAEAQEDEQDQLRVVRLSGLRLADYGTHQVRDASRPCAVPAPYRANFPPADVQAAALASSGRIVPSHLSAELRSLLGISHLASSLSRSSSSIIPGISPLSLILIYHA